MAKAWLVPGRPMERWYVGASVARSKSTEALRARGVVVRVGLELRVVRRGHDEGAGADEVVEERLREGGALRGIGAGAQLVEQHERALAGHLDDARDGAQVPAERGQRLRHGLLVADVREDVAEDGQRAAVGHRHVQPGLVHEHQQAHRAQGHRLAAGVGAGDDERRVVAAEAHVDGHHRPAQAGVPRGEQGDRARRRRLPARIGIELIGEARPAEPEVEAGQGVQVGAQGLGVGADVGGELVEDPLLLRLGRQLRLAPRVGQLHRHERLDEEGLPAARLVVDDALDPALGIGPHRHHVAAVAQRDERLLQRPREVRVDERLEPAAQSFMGQRAPTGAGRPAPARPCPGSRRPGRRWPPVGRAGPARGRGFGTARGAAAAPPRAARRRGGRPP